MEFSHFISSVGTTKKSLRKGFNGVLLGLFCLASNVSAQQLIHTVVGNGTAGFGGDAGPAKAAQLNRPFDVVMDSSGNLFIADRANHRIRKVDSKGIITTVAGNGTAGFSGDNGPATAAQLAGANGVAVDSSGNLFIADRANHRIRKVDGSGVITTVAGNGTVGFSGDNGPATAAQLNAPSYIAVDSSGNLFISDLYNNRIRKVDGSGVITTVAGNGTAGFGGENGPATAAQLKYPTGITLDSSGNLFFADQNNHRLRKVDSKGIITTVAGNGTAGFSGDNGPATAAQLQFPGSVAVDNSGNLFIADSGNQRLRKVDSKGVITTVAGEGTEGFGGDGGPATAAQMNRPSAVTLGSSSGNLFIADPYNNRIRALDFLPLAPTNVVATSGNAQALLSWTVPPGNGGSAVTSFTVTSQPAGATCPVTIAAGSAQQSCTATGLTNGVSYVFSVVATNAVGNSPAATSNPVVPTVPLALAAPNVPGAQLGEAYSLQLVASGGSGGYIYALAPSSAALPEGLTLDPASGLVSGTPKATAGSYPVTLVVKDSAGATSNLPLTIQVVLADVSASQSLPAGVVGKSYSASIVATGGTGGYGFTLASGQLPAGLSLNSDTGAITGTPTKEETANFSVTVVDSTLKAARAKAGGTTVHSTTQAYTIPVTAAAVPGATPTPVPSLSALGIVLLNFIAVALGLRSRRKAATS